MYSFILIAIFTIIFLGLLFLKTKDSSGKPNNALLIFYLAVSLWITAGLGGIYNQIYPSREASLGASKRISKSRPISKHSGHYNLILWGLILCSGVYVVRRPEWAGMIIDGIAAWRGKDLDRSKEMLIQHALLNPEDRDFVRELLIELSIKRVEKELDDPIIIPPDVELK